MIRLPRALMIGAADRNVGKTAFAEALIQREARRGPVAALKVTTVREVGRCPRGGRGCGVCGNLRGPYAIDRETRATGDKDTCRLLAAGADPVHWLRVRLSSLTEGLTAILDRIPTGRTLVIESNAARSVSIPDLFVVIQTAGASEIKASCAEVLGQAQLRLEFDGAGWEPGPERCRLTSAGWFPRHRANAIVLAGGSSTRMGHDKATLPWHGGSLLAHIVGILRPRCDGVFVGGGQGTDDLDPAIPIVPDRQPGQGPLMGLASCLAASDRELNLVVGCDMPQLDAHYLDRLLAATTPDIDAVVPRQADGRWEPLLAVYRRSRVLPVVERGLTGGTRRLRTILPNLRIAAVEAPTGWYRNLNTPADYRAALNGSPPC